MNKKKLMVVIDILLGVILVGVMTFGIYQYLKSDGEKFKAEYEALNNENVNINISKNNPIKYVTLDEVFDIIQNKTGVIYFGFPGCPWCRNMIPVLFEAAKNNNIDTIYYFNPRNVKKSDNDEYNKLKEILNEYLSEDENGQKVLYVPDVYFIKDGKIVGHHLGTVDSQEDPTISLTEEEKNELLDIFNELFEKIRN
jgi:predicted bacteriocin transport accessory protein